MLVFFFQVHFGGFEQDLWLVSASTLISHQFCLPPRKYKENIRVA